MQFVSEISIDGIIQSVLVLALVGVTVWYTWQIRRQANNSEVQITMMKERETRAKRVKQLDDIISWAKNINEWDNTRDAVRINETIGDDEPLMKSLLVSLNCNADFIRFRNNGETVVLPIAETFSRQSLTDSITALNSKLNEYLVSLGSEQIAMMKALSAGNKLATDNICALENITVRYRRDTIPTLSQLVITEASKLKLTI